jgi:DNA-binding winged helix-turn-helix (wHTH) protein
MMHDEIYRFGEFSFFPGERSLFRGDKRAVLSPKAFDVLGLLVRHHGSLVSRTELFRVLWPGIHVSEANLTNIIVLLRKTLGRDAIQTLSKFGYRFTLRVTGEPGISHGGYESFVRGKELLAQRSRESIMRARDLFWFCLAQDPQFAAAWAWLGRACRLLDKFNGEPAEPDVADAAFQRAFAIDPELACAHQFYTQLEVDSGRASQALIRLASRMKSRGEDPEALAALVQVLRCCGLLDQSVAAHERAAILDPAVKTSVAHTHFLSGDYARVFETYTGGLYYLDAAAWAALGAPERAASLLRTRVTQPVLGPVMANLMSSLLAVLEGDHERACALMQTPEGFREPEVLFYYARHFAIMDAREKAVDMVRRARRAGFWCSYCIERDAVFTRVRRDPEFAREVEDAKQMEVQAAQSLHAALGDVLATRIVGVGLSDALRGNSM